MNDLVSVILPVYNSEETILDTINSILCQTYSNFELLVVNDGSTDNTDKLCKKLEDKRIKYFCRNNSGVSGTRNFALDNANGKYIVFIDSDDKYENDYLFCLVNRIQEGYQLVTCGYKNFGKSLRCFIPLKKIYTDKLEYICSLQSSFLFNQIWNKIYLKEVIDINNLRFDENLSIAEDWNFNVEYLKNIDSFSVVDKSLYNYRISSAGLGFRYRNDANEVKLQIIDKIIKYFDVDCICKFNANSYLKQYFSYFSNIVDRRNKLSKREKKEKINFVIHSEDYQFRLKKVENSISKNKYLFNLLKTRNINLIYIFAKIANIYDRLNKKIKFGL